MTVTNNAGGMYNDETQKYVIPEPNAISRHNTEHDKWVRKGIENGWLKVEEA